MDLSPSGLPRRPLSTGPDQYDPHVNNPRRKFRRRATDSLSNLKDGSSDDVSVISMSDSEEHEMEPIGSDDEIDEETGLSTEDRQKFLKRKRRKDALDARIGGSGTLSKDEARAADRNVVRRLLFNAFLIVLWYIFSLSISLVRI